MTWIKQGLFYVPEPQGDWMVSHAQMPVVDLLDDGIARVYFGTRNRDIHTQTTYLEMRADDPSDVLYVHDAPVLGCGELGCFDDGGAMPSWIVDHDGRKYLYYVGWNAGVTVSYRNSLGLAVSDDEGRSFTRMFPGPIVDRTPTEPHWCSTPCVRLEGDRWRMWYLNGTGWDILDGRPEPYCHIKYAESDDGVNWQRDGHVALELGPGEGGMTKPHVIHEDGTYKMWYAYRGAVGYRTDPSKSYRIGYAESDDGIDWTRLDDRVGIDVSEEGWDSTMISFPFVYDHGGRRFLVYNGNGFGATGIGWAVWDD